MLAFAACDTRLISALAICAIAAQGLPQQTTKRNIPCKTPENALPATGTHGRLSIYNWILSHFELEIVRSTFSAFTAGPSTFPSPHERG